MVDTNRFVSFVNKRLSNFSNETSRKTIKDHNRIYVYFLNNNK